MVQNARSAETLLSTGSFIGLTSQNLPNRWLIGEVLLRSRDKADYRGIAVRLVGGFGGGAVLLPP